MSEVFHSTGYLGDQKTLPCNTDKPHRCPGCHSVLYNSTEPSAQVLPFHEYRECWNCHVIVEPEPEAARRGFSYYSSTRTYGGIEKSLEFILPFYHDSEVVDDIRAMLTTDVYRLYPGYLPGRIINKTLSTKLHFDDDTDNDRVSLHIIMKHNRWVELSAFSDLIENKIAKLKWHLDYEKLERHLR